MSRVYIVEDEALVAMLLEDMVTELGHEVVGIGARLEVGLAAAESVSFDLAILDINLNGQVSFPIAHALAKRGIPFLFASGYGAAGLEESLCTVPVLSKPFSMAQLDQVIRQRLTASGV
ncbi:response regulator (plasmid) [Pseudomonas sp. HR96]|uniref:response regulator n=1 Tax=Pseudomonas sp. HR96 TaxID=1027966 RepID=UPI002A75A996|nr:response regulator [Pseudomonas sp. HR96]WPP02395.1 response regulator [Pseudomonas sp. HR96]